MRYSVSTFLFMVPLAFVLVALQAAIVSNIALLGIHADVLLIAVALVTMLSGRNAGMIAGIIMAPVYDTMAGLPLGISILPFMAVAYLTDLTKRTVIGGRLAWPMLVGFFGTLLAGAITLLELALLGRTVLWLDTFVRIVIPTGLFNAVFLLIFYIPAMYLRDRRTVSTP